MDECLGLLLPGGRGLDQDERLNAGGQIISVTSHPKLQGRDFLGESRRHDVSAISTRDADCHSLVNGALEDVCMLLCLGLSGDSSSCQNCAISRSVEELTWERRIKIWMEDPVPERVFWPPRSARRVAGVRFAELAPGVVCP
jgi:hypothetical protein